MAIKLYLANFIHILAQVLIISIIIRVIMSWIRPMGSKGRLFVFLFEITEPLMSFFRKIIPRIGMIDISPIVALLAIELAHDILIALLA